jgi:hypothetical protein
MIKEKSASTEPVFIVFCVNKHRGMNTDQIKRHLADKGTVINDYQAQQVMDVICKFKEEMKICQPKMEWTFDVQQVGTDSFTFEYAYRVTRLIQPAP